MNTSSNTYDTIEHLIYSQKLRIESLAFIPEKDKMLIDLSNGLKLIVNTKHYKSLKGATPVQLNNYHLVGKGTGIHWPDLDEDLSLKGFLSEAFKQIIVSKNELVIV